jgi:hypothetical protein
MEDFMETIGESFTASLRGQKFYGKYRGQVVQNVDPQRMGRIQAIVPDVSQLIPTGWAMPCVPAAFVQSGMFAIPAVGAQVWMEFERGDPDYPIWTGCFWGDQQIPAHGETFPSTLSTTPVSPNIMLQTPGQNTILLYGIPSPMGGITLCCGPLDSQVTPRIELTPQYIKISNGTANITVTATSVIINDGALAVT